MAEGRLQPDFPRLFSAHFGSEPKPVSYKLRFDANLLHDLQFMAVLTHDAVAHPRRSERKGSKLVLPLRRECWELPATEIDGVQHLHVVESEISIRPVHDMRWELPHELLLKGEPELALHNLHVGSDFWDPEQELFSFLLQGLTWKCVVSVEKGASIVLRDLGRPMLDKEFFQQAEEEPVSGSSPER